MSSDAKDIVIIGGGIMGATTAYYISRHPSFSPSWNVTLIEASAHGPAQGASGKAGGLIARWASPEELADVSFPEHERLAQEHIGAERWGYRKVRCGSWQGRAEHVDAGMQAQEKKETVHGGGRSTRRKAVLPEDMNVVNRDLTDAYSPIGSLGDTAQVHPYLFTTSMLELAKEKGVIFVPGRVTNISYDDGAVSSVTYNPNGESSPKTIPATDVILAAGAWSRSLIPSLPITGRRAHSVTIHCPPTSTPSADVLFVEVTLPSARGRGNKTASNEIYARPGNEVYACGPTDSSSVPDHIDDVEVDAAACASLIEHVQGISDLLREGTVDKRQACYLPQNRFGSPIVGAASSIAKGLYIATGHTCWGICNAPGTAKALTELILEGRTQCVNLESFDPSNFI